MCCSIIVASSHSNVPQIDMSIALSHKIKFVIEDLAISIRHLRFMKKLSRGEVIFAEILRGEFVVYMYDYNLHDSFDETINQLIHSLYIYSDRWTFPDRFLTTICLVEDKCTIGK